MQYFSNNRIVNFKDLRKSGIYSNILLDELEQGNYKFLKELLSETDRGNRNIMEPILYAVRNEHNTYQIYTYYAKVLQENKDLAKEIVRYEPELIYNTSVSNNRQFILEMVNINPEVVKYMSKTLKEDTEFIEDLCEINNKEVMLNVAKECDISELVKNNPELLSNKEFMIGAVISDSNYIEHIDESLKNDYGFIRATSKENYEVVEHIVQNTEKFGLEAIKGAKDTTREITIDDYMKIIDEMSENSDDSRYKMVKEKIMKNGADDPRAIRWITAMVAQSDNVSPDMLKKVLDYSVLEMSKIKKDLTEDGNEKISKDNALELVAPHILNTLRRKAIEQGLEIDEELEKKIKEYEEFYKEYMEKIREKKKENLKNSKEQDSEEQNSKNIALKDIEKVTEGANLQYVKEETEVIRKEIKRDNISKADVTIEDIGEKTNEDDGGRS